FEITSVVWHMPPQNETPGMEFFSHCAGRLMGVVRIPLLSWGDEHPESKMSASNARIPEFLRFIILYFACK
ncbi:MAG: hypothetical protein WCS96_01180, partial [Victivallales bacterium]